MTARHDGAAVARYGEVVVVTGADGPIGLELTRRVSATGARVIIATRSSVAGEQAAARIRRDDPAARLDVRRVDPAELSSVRGFVSDTLRTENRIDLVLAAGALGVSPSRIVTNDGFEAQLAGNFLGPLSLMIGLMPALLASPNARLVTMSSPAARLGRINLADLNSEQSYHPFGAYAQSRLAALISAVHLAKVAERRGWDVASLIADCGNVRSDPALGGTALPRVAEILHSRALPSQTVEQGVESALLAAASPHLVTGDYLGPGGPFALTGRPARRRLPRRATNHQTAGVLWRAAQRMTGAVLPTRF